MKRYGWTSGALLLALCLSPAYGDTPRQMACQGKLTGMPGPVDLTVRLFDAATTGTKLLEEAHPAVPLNNGVFSILIGSTVPVTDDVLAHPEVRLEVAIGLPRSPTPLSPRTRLLMVPYAARAGLAEGLVAAGRTEPSVRMDAAGSVGVAAPAGHWLASIASASNGFGQLNVGNEQGSVICQLMQHPAEFGGGLWDERGL